MDDEVGSKAVVPEVVPEVVPPAPAKQDVHLTQITQTAQPTSKVSDAFFLTTWLII